MKVVGYVRVSTKEQAEEGQSIEAQKAKLAAYAALYDLQLVAVFEDPGSSGKSLDRPGLQAALAALNAGEAGGLLVAKLDRLTRSVGDWQRLVDGYFGERAGKQLLSVADHVDTRTASGRMVLNILLSVAQGERETIGERTRAALRHKIAKGERCGKVRFGYDVTLAGVLVPNPREQQAVALMRDLRGMGLSYPAIARELQDRGVRTKEGGPWLNTSVRSVLARAGRLPA